MINEIYRLHAPKKFRLDLVEEKPAGADVIIRPRFLSICAADMRYFAGQRDPKALAKKLPMALIHEAVGQVVADPTGKFKIGGSVVMIPNMPTKEDAIIKENYRRSSYFRSSGHDGFMSALVCLPADRVVKISKTPGKIAAMTELISVAMNALSQFDRHAHARRLRIGVWGDGAVGFCTALSLRFAFPQSELLVFGANPEKLSYFTFADQTFLTTEIPNDLSVDHAFECVGGPYSEAAINQIIDLIEPQGVLSLMGVSEQKIPINTRMVLEKGLQLIGHSRSGRADFLAAVKFLEKTPVAREYLAGIISEIVPINDFVDLVPAFDSALQNDFKTILEWNL